MFIIIALQGFICISSEIRRSVVKMVLSKEIGDITICGYVWRGRKRSYTLVKDFFTSSSKVGLIRI